MFIINIYAVFTGNADAVGNFRNGLTINPANTIFIFPERTDIDGLNIQEIQYASKGDIKRKILLAIF